MKKMSRIFSLLSILVLIVTVNKEVYADTVFENDAHDKSANHSGNVEASNYMEGYGPERAFDQISSSYGWVTKSGFQNGWISFEFPQPKTIMKYTITATSNYREINTSPKDWVFEGWNGHEWIPLDTRSNITSWGISEKKEFILKPGKSASYKKYRLHITSTLDQNKHNYLQISEIELLDNRIINSGFEKKTGKNRLADFWGHNVPLGATADFEVLTNNVGYGKQSQKISGSKIPKDKYISIKQDIDVIPNKQFEISGYVSVAKLADAQAQLYVDFFGADGWITKSVINIPNKTNGFVYFNNRGITPLNAKTARVHMLIRATKDNGSGTIIVDDIIYKYLR